MHDFGVILIKHPIASFWGLCPPDPLLQRSPLYSDLSLRKSWIRPWLSLQLSYAYVYSVKQILQLYSYNAFIIEQSDLINVLIIYLNYLAS